MLFYEMKGLMHTDVFFAPVTPDVQALLATDDMLWT
jgi:hypothetical protein